MSATLSWGPVEILHTDVLVIGSGPGGATTAARLAEAGRDVILVEEGSYYSLESAENYTLAEMDQKYRNGGLNTTLGRTNVTYIEGRCVGGASEINAALYHRPHPETLSAWAREFRIADFGMDSLDPYFREIEQELWVSPRAEGLSPQSHRIIRGAEALGWKHTQIERFWKYPGEGRWGRRQSMSETMVPRARAAGARLLADTQVVRLRTRGARAVEAHALTGAHGLRDKLCIRFEQVVACGGTVQTPLLLRRSGIRQGIGDDLRLHPMVRIAARFDQAVNEPAFGVPVQQVEEFKPAMTLGCSHSSLPHIAMWLGQQVPDRAEIMADWRKVGVFYVATQGQGRGTIRALPVLGEPLVRYDLTQGDLDQMGLGLQRLGRLLFKAGARELFSPVEGQGPLRSEADLERLGSLPQGASVAVSTIHLFSSAPMGEDDRRCPVDSFGRLRGWDNIRVHDASILPSSPGVNPQGTIMAIVRRNTRHMLAQG